MFNPKVLSIFNHVEQQSLNIMKEVDAFMQVNIVTWADELNEMLLQECTASKDSARFLLPKTPSERKTRNKKTRKASAAKCSTVNGTFLQSETSCLDDTISTRTRAAKRAATSKISQLNLTKLHTFDESQTRNLSAERNTKDITESTFVLPKASKRTKPVLKSTQPEPTPPEPQGDEVEVPNTSNRVSRVSEKGSPLKRASRGSTRTPPSRASPRQSSRVVSASPAEQQNEQKTILLDETLTERPSRREKSRTLSGGPAERRTRSHSGSAVSRSGKVTRSLSPVNRSMSLRSRGSSAKPGSLRPSKRSSSAMAGEEHKVSDAGAGRSLAVNETITIKREASRELAAVVVNETFTVGGGEGGSPAGTEKRSLTGARRSTGAGGEAEKTSHENDQEQMEIEMEENAISSTRIADVTDCNGGATFLVGDEAETSDDAQVPKKKRKVKKEDEEVKENVEEVGETVRITRTKSKAIKKMMEESETKQADLSAFAKKLINRAKMTSLKKNQLAALLECNESTPKNGPGQLTLPFGNLTASKSKYHLLLSGSKKLKTPLATLPNSAMKIVKASGDKERMKPVVASRDSSCESAVRSVKKPGKDELLEKEIKLQSKKEKEKEAALKRQNVIKTKMEELKRKNELKHQMAMKKREKLEQEKYNLIQSEKEKEERHKLLLQERQFKLKEEAYKKKMLTQQKIAETNERRRLEEEARLAKLKEMEAEEQRLALEKQKEQERQERRAQERLAQKKAQQEYEMQLKQEMEAERLRMEKLQTAKKCLASASKIQSASKRPKFEVVSSKREWDYKPRNENDYGLENEDSEMDSEDEKSYDNSKPAVPWAKKIMHGKSPFLKVLTLEMLCEFMPCYQKSPDIYKMFRMTPSKRIKRSSSAIWNTPGSKQT